MTMTCHLPVGDLMSMGDPKPLKPTTGGMSNWRIISMTTVSH